MNQDKYQHLYDRIRVAPSAPSHAEVVNWSIGYCLKGLEELDRDLTEALDPNLRVKLHTARANLLKTLHTYSSDPSSQVRTEDA